MGSALVDLLSLSPELAKREVRRIRRRPYRWTRLRLPWGFFARETGQLQPSTTSTEQVQRSRPLLASYDDN